MKPRTSYHKWTPAEVEELTMDIKVQGIEVAVINFENKYNLPHHCVYNRAWRIIKEKGLVNKRSYPSDQPMDIDKPTAVKRIRTKSDPKIIVMLSKESQHLITLSFEDGRIIINYPAGCIADVKMI